MLDVEVIDDPAAATVALEPVRSRLLSELAEPASAATLAARLGIARQKINYHLRALESHGLVRVAAKRRWGGLTERLLVASASSYVVGPSALGPVAADPGRTADQLSASYLIALAARIIREVSTFVRRSAELDKRLPTLSIDAEIRFRSAADRAAFSRDLAEAVKALAAHYHDESDPSGRSHRLVVAAYPLPHKPATRETS
jgi:predicted ArsR family transcriptional regulator